MNPADLLDLGLICRNRAETKLGMKFHFLTLRTMINAIIYNFGYEDAELHSNFLTAPPLRAPNSSFEGVEDISLGFSLEPVRALSYAAEQSEAPLLFQLPPKLCDIT